MSKDTSKQHSLNMHSKLQHVIYTASSESYVIVVPGTAQAKLTKHEVFENILKSARIQPRQTDE